jgi:hypothetical protein
MVIRPKAMNADTKPLAAKQSIICKKFNSPTAVALQFLNSDKA